MASPKTTFYCGQNETQQEILPHLSAEKRVGYFFKLFKNVRHTFLILLHK